MYLCESDWFTQYGPVKHWVHCKSISRAPHQIILYPLLAGNTQKLGKSKLASSSLFIFALYFSAFTINELVYLFECFTLSPFEKMLGSWYPEFVHIHVFMRIHETINNNQEDLKN